MNSLKIIDIYPVSIIDADDELITRLADSPIDHMIKSIEFNLLNIDDILESDEVAREWSRHMPPMNNLPNIKEYRDNYDSLTPDIHTLKLDQDFKKFETTIPPGQILFHSGLWPANKDELLLTRYISTSIDPVFTHGVKQHGDIFVVIKIMSPNIKFYFFDPKVENGHAEAEILLEKGITLIKIHSYKVKMSYNANEYEDVFYAEAYKIS